MRPPCASSTSCTPRVRSPGEGDSAIRYLDVGNSWCKKLQTWRKGGDRTPDMETSWWKLPRLEQLWGLRVWLPVAGGLVQSAGGGLTAAMTSCICGEPNVL